MKLKFVHLFEKERAIQNAKREKTAASYITRSPADNVSVQTSGSARLFCELTKFAEDLKNFEIEVLDGDQALDNNNDDDQF